jgi:hypothetical protein
VWVIELIVWWVLDLLEGGPSRRLPSRKVVGHAMEPTLVHGQRIVPRTLLRSEPKVGQIVVAKVGEREIVQRVSADTTEGFVLAGDYRAAREDAGPVPRAQIIGVVEVAPDLLRLLFRRRPRAAEM